MAEVTAPGTGHPVKAFSISRTFDAPKELVFKAWTEAERMSQWWGPKGFPVKVVKLEAMPTGVFLYCIELPGGQAMWGKFVYQSIETPNRLVFVNSFSDEHEGITRNPFIPNWPQEIMNNVTFTEQDGKTTVTLQGAPHNASDVERQTFESSFDSMQQGFSATFDQLDTYLARL